MLLPLYLISTFEVGSDTIPNLQMKQLWLSELKQFVQDMQLVIVRIKVWTRARQVKHLGHKM